MFILISEDIAVVLFDNRSLTLAEKCGSVGWDGGLRCYH